MWITLGFVEVEAYSHWFLVSMIVRVSSCSKFAGLWLPDLVRQSMPIFHLMELSFLDYCSRAPSSEWPGIVFGCWRKLGTAMWFLALIEIQWAIIVQIVCSERLGAAWWWYRVVGCPSDARVSSKMSMFRIRLVGWSIVLHKRIEFNLFFSERLEEMIFVNFPGHLRERRGCFTDITKPKTCDELLKDLTLPVL